MMETYKGKIAQGDVSLEKAMEYFLDRFENEDKGVKERYDKEFGSVFEGPEYVKKYFACKGILSKQLKEPRWVELSRIGTDDKWTEERLSLPIGISIRGAVLERWREEGPTEYRLWYTPHVREEYSFDETGNLVRNPQIELKVKDHIQEMGIPSGVQEEYH